jgi:putative transposase
LNERWASQAIERSYQGASAAAFGEIERWHQTLKNCILLEHYYLPGDLERQVAPFVAHYNHARYHESVGNLTPADVYFGRAETILLERERIKRQTIANPRLQHQLHAA